MSLTGTLVRFDNFYSKHVAFRNVDVWLPPGYDPEGMERYPVLYMHDGQNLFDDTISYGSISWGIDRALLSLLEEDRIRPTIVVGIWNSDIRWREYMPQKAFESDSFKKHRKVFVKNAGGNPVANGYLKFLVVEVKPFIDEHYKTLSDQANTFVMGSSMGGLISLYAISEYPHVFGGAGCISTHWPIGGMELVDLMGQRLPDPASHRLYFDFGTETLDRLYEPFQRRMDDHLRLAGYSEGQNWVTLRCEGAEHSERSWRERVEIPLSFLLG